MSVGHIDASLLLAHLSVCMHACVSRCTLVHVHACVCMQTGDNFDL